jgi:hypothetical protein
MLMKVVMIVAVGLVSGRSGASAAVLRVPADFPTVLAAVDAAAPGDTVLVGPGNWTDTENRVLIEDGLPSQITACAFPMHGMSIIGEAGASQTILDVGGTGVEYIRAISWKFGATGTLLVDGFTIRGINGPQYAVGVFAFEAGQLLVRNCVFEGTGSPAEGGAVGAFGSTEVQVAACEFRRLSNEEGVVQARETTIGVANCVFEDIWGRGVRVSAEFEYATATVENSVFTRIRGRGNGCGIGMVLVPGCTIRGCEFIENSGSEFGGGAVYLTNCSDGIVEFNTFVRDSVTFSSGRGGGLVVVSSGATVRNNTFVGCHSSQAGSSATIVSTQTAFSHNAVVESSGGSALHAPGSVFASNECNLYWMNAGGDFGTWPPPTGYEWRADPLFCGPELLDFTVRDDSPCIYDNGCGQIGSQGVGCTSVALSPWSWGQIKNAYRTERQR